METPMIKVDANDLRQLVQDVKLLKNVLLSEGELTDWAKKELAEARADEENNISLEDLKKEIEDVQG